MGSTSRVGEKYTDHLLNLLRIKYRQNDAKEFCIPSYFHFVRVLEVPFKVYRGDFQGTLTLVYAPRAKEKKIENKNLGFFPRYLPNYCAAQCSVGFMTSFFCSLIGSSEN